MDVGTTAEEGIFLTETEMVSRYRGKVSAGTLKNWRSQGRGPPFVKIGRQVLYPIEQLEAWERSRTLCGL
jgi:Helix-turn-helix domain